MDPVVIKGSKFFYKNNGTQFFVKGVYYRYPILPIQVGGDMASFVDPLSDDRVCQRDIPHLVKLGINTLLVDGWNADREHQKCMQLLLDAGIYVLPVVNGYSDIALQFNGTVATPVSYVAVNHFFRATDFFRKWNNTLGLVFFIQDVRDIINFSLPSQKRYIGETKEYMRSRGYRDIPLGVAGSEWVPKRYNMAQYMACDDEPATASDFYLTWPRDYDFTSWCSNPTARFDDIRERYLDYPRPLILSDGCQKGKLPNVEQFKEIVSNPLLPDMYSGTVFHEWLEHNTLTYEMFTWSKTVPAGLVNINGTNVTTNPIYSAVSSRLTIATPAVAQLSDSSPSKPLPCEEFVLKKGEHPTNVTEDLTMKYVLPSRSSSRLCGCMMNTLSCIGDSDTPLVTSMEKLYALWQTCKAQPDDPKYCFGFRMQSQTGVYDSYIHCNETEKLAWALDRYSNSSDTCTSVKGIVQTPKPTASLAQDCQVLLRQAGPSGTGTVTDFPSDATSSLTATQLAKNNVSSDSGKKVGIVVGVVSLLAAVIGGLLLYRRARKAAARKKEAEARKDLEAETYQKVELPDSAIARTELQTNEVHELESPDPVIVEADEGVAKSYVELAGDFSIELDGTEIVNHEAETTLNNEKSGQLEETIRR